MPYLLTVMMTFSFPVFHSVLLWFCVTVMMRFLFCPLFFLVSPPLPIPLFALTLHCSLMAVAYAPFNHLLSELLVPGFLKLMPWEKQDSTPPPSSSSSTCCYTTEQDKTEGT
jgi:hypothetical protein